ncbi:hypothetical protein H0H87_001792, partial [Tephrocybe sp. NHM501043]
MADHYPEQTWLSRVLPDDQPVSNRRRCKTLFEKSKGVVSIDETTAITLNVRPHHQALIDIIAHQYGLPDLRAALGDFAAGWTYVQRNGQRKSSAVCPLPFDAIDVWQNFWIQHCSLQDSRLISPHHTIQALPPSGTSSLPFGRCNTVLVAEQDNNRSFSVVG